VEKEENNDLLKALEEAERLKAKEKEREEIKKEVIAEMVKNQLTVISTTENAKMKRARKY
jgi:hypothetical protein